MLFFWEDFQRRKICNQQKKLLSKLYQNFKFTAILLLFRVCVGVLIVNRLSSIIIIFISFLILSIDRCLFVCLFGWLNEWNKQTKNSIKTKLTGYFNKQIDSEHQREREREKNFILIFVFLLFNCSVCVIRCIVEFFFFKCLFYFISFEFSFCLTLMMSSNRNKT